MFVKNSLWKFGSLQTLMLPNLRLLIASSTMRDRASLFWLDFDEVIFLDDSRQAMHQIWNMYQNVTHMLRIYWTNVRLGYKIPWWSLYCGLRSFLKYYLPNTNSWEALWAFMLYEIIGIDCAIVTGTQLPRRYTFHTCLIPEIMIWCLRETTTVTNMNIYHFLFQCILEFIFHKVTL